MATFLFVSGAVSPKERHRSCLRYEDPQKKWYVRKRTGQCKTLQHFRIMSLPGCPFFSWSLYVFLFCLSVSVQVSLSPCVLCLCPLLSPFILSPLHVSLNLPSTFLCQPLTTLFLSVPPLCFILFIPTLKEKSRTINNITLLMPSFDSMERENAKYRKSPAYKPLCHEAISPNILTQ